MNTDKKLGPVLAIFVVASSMIGSGIFLLPASLGAVGSISIIAWVMATAGAALIGGVFAWLAVARPKCAGLFSYVREAFGPGPAFVTGALYWASCLVGCVAIALGVTGYLAVFIPAVGKPSNTALVTIVIIWLLTGANLIGPRFIAGTQGWSLGLGLVPVFLVAIGGWFIFHGATFAASWNVSGQTDLGVLPRTTVMVFWAFLGLEGASVLAVRVKKPSRDVPIGTLGGLALSAVVYMSASAAIMGILPAAALAKSTAPFADAVVPMLGAFAAGAVALCAMIKASGTLATAVLLTVETAESESVMGQIAKHMTPAAGRASTANLLFTGVLASLLVIVSVSPTLARQFTMVTNVSVVLSVLAYTAGSLALIRLSGSLPQRQRIWARVLGVCAAVFCAWLIRASDPDLLVWSAGAIVLAVLAYAMVRMRRNAMALAKA
ncbi:MAG: amino acid permease [Rhizomicrobium sp.]|jgi:arginine:agmatine antiporter